MMRSLLARPHSLALSRKGHCPSAERPAVPLSVSRHRGRGSKLQKGKKNEGRECTSRRRDPRQGMRPHHHHIDHIRLRSPDRMTRLDPHPRSFSSSSSSSEQFHTQLCLPLFPGLASFCSPVVWTTTLIVCLGGSHVVQNIQRVQSSASLSGACPKSSLIPFP